MAASARVGSSTRVISPGDRLPCLAALVLIRTMSTPPTDPDREGSLADISDSWRLARTPRAACIPYPPSRAALPALRGAIRGAGRPGDARDRQAASGLGTQLRLPVRAARPISKHHGGAEIESSFLFADIRGSTTLAEHHVRYSVPSAPRPLLRGGLRRRIRSRRWRRQVRRRRGRRDVLSTHVRAATRREGRERCGGAVGGGQATPTRADRGSPSERASTRVKPGSAPWAMTRTPRSPPSATPSTPQRASSSAAGAGEILVTAAAAQAADLGPGLERRALALKGKESPTEVVSLRVGGH